MNDKMKMLDLVLEEQRTAFSNGESVCGRVLLQVPHVIDVRALGVFAGGCELVSWQRSRLLPLAKQESDEVQFYSDAHEMLNSLYMHFYNVGFYVFFFRPLPASFSGKYGSVHYWVKAVLQRPLSPDQVVCKEFPVINNIDVSAPALLVSFHPHSEKWVRRSIFCEQLVSLRASINRTGYCSGETVPICAKFENYSSCFVVPKACIYQTQTFLAKGKSKTYKQEVASVRGIPIPPFKTQRWNPNELKIPSITASILNSTIIRVEYSLVTLLEIPDSGLAVDLPIVIGTIPIQQSGYGTGSNASGQYSADLSPLTLALPQPLKAPPTYEGTVSGRECEPHAASASHLEKLEREFGGQLFSYIEGMRFQPPPRFSEVGDTNPQPSDCSDSFNCYVTY
uniref:Arrestin C-terminal-like domain-containing protein n=1 Tax=Scleropages formosus TaxID=113540 RepID=A0A8C9R5T5_SCLFO